jgi:hypothetical protein
MHHLLALYRHALRTGNRPLAAALARALRSDPRLRERADRDLRARPRGPASGRCPRACADSAAAERALHAVLRRLGTGD